MCTDLFLSNEQKRLGKSWLHLESLQLKETEKLLLLSCKEKSLVPTEFVWPCLSIELFCNYIDLHQLIDMYQYWSITQEEKKKLFSLLILQMASHCYTENHKWKIKPLWCLTDCQEGQNGSSNLQHPLQKALRDVTEEGRKAAKALVLAAEKASSLEGRKPSSFLSSFAHKQHRTWKRKCQVTSLNMQQGGLSQWRDGY